MAEITKRETRNRGERRPVVAPPPPSKAAAPSVSKSLKRKAPSPPAPPPEPLRSRDAPGLPSLREKQLDDLPDTEWKSISESGVLATSLKLSMEKWRHGGCFEKYWVKNPVKKVHRDFQNPPTASMSRLGSAVMTIEPHAFEVLLYSVRSIPSAQAASINSFNQAIPPYSSTNQSIAPNQTPGKKGKAQPQVATVAKMTPQSKATAKVGPEEQSKSTLAGSTKDQNGKSGSGNNLVGKSPAQQPPVDPSSNNPVIKELAHRASLDSGLKDLMKIVAQGGATEIQLKEFQRHIDEINAILKGKLAPTSSTKTTSAATTSQTQNSSRQIQPMTWTQPITPNIKQEPGTHQPISNPKIKPIPPQRPETSAVIFEIISGTGDRYLIPRKSLLEYRDGTRLAVLSFLVHLKGMSADGGFYESEKEYCELITLKLLADRPGILEPLRRAVDSPEVVRRHMEEWADKMNIAEKAYLMLRLRSVPETEDSRPQTAVPIVKEEAVKSEYEAPNSLFPLQRKVVVGRT